MELYKVIVEKKEKENLFVKVLVLYQDAGMPVNDYEFFLEVIVEALGPMNKKLDRLPPLAQEVLKSKPSKNLSLYEMTKAFVDKSEGEKPHRFIREIELLEEYEGIAGPIDSDDEKAVEENTIYKGMGAYATFRISMTDEKWISHLNESDEIETACYFA